MFTLAGTSVSFRIAAPEICDNAIDDDGDGFIDLNDTDCICASAEPKSLIPNPSFEERNCCPSDRSQLHCAKGWIQASAATTDYMHECGWSARTEYPVPLPIPDGKGYVGWRNGSVGNPQFKEYSGACLKGPLQAGVNYRFEFWVGFTNAINSPPTNIVFFGTPSCTNLPFGVGNDRFGCPTNGTGWIQLGAVPISGANEWKLYEITVTPTVDIKAIAIGPDCVPITASVNYYYFFDNLVLAAQSEFAFNIQQKGHSCSSSMTLEVEARDTLTYQWYKEGIAIPGQTGAKYTGPKADGSYQVRISSSTGCAVSKPFIVNKPSFVSKAEQVVCNGKSFSFHGKTLSKSGIYYDTFSSSDGCDSTIQLTLKVLGNIVDTIDALIHEGESYEVGNSTFNAPGIYTTLLSSWRGCDSTVVLFLDYFRFYFPNAFSPNGDGVNDYFMIYAPKGVAEITSLQVFDRWGGLQYHGTHLDPGVMENGWNGTRNGKSAKPGVYLYKAVVQFHDGRLKTLAGGMTLVK